MLLLLIIGSLDLISYLGIWATIQSAVCIICCCAPVYKPLFPDRPWSRIASKICAHGPRLKSKHKNRSPGLRTGPWQLASLDPYLEEDGHFYTEAYTGGISCLISSDARRGSSYSNKRPPMDSIQVDRRVDVDYPTVCPTSEQEVIYFPENFQPSMPSPTHFRPLRVSPDIACASNPGQAQ